jgi:acetyl-CoA C-acetyltransferase
MDQWAYESHMKASAARADGRLAEEIVPMKVTKFDGSVVLWDTDEHPRADSTLEKLASLKPLHPEIEGFSITAGNAAGVNDAAAAVMITSDAVAKAKGLKPLATIKAWSQVAVDPVETGLAPVTAIPKALAKAGLKVEDVDLFEINEAFASVPVAACKLLNIDPAKVNPVGSGCSLGHPISASGARMIVSLVHELRRRGGGIGVASMCAGGGMGAAVVIEVAGA